MRGYEKQVTHGNEVTPTTTHPLLLQHTHNAEASAEVQLRSSELQRFFASRQELALERESSALGMVRSY